MCGIAGILSFASALGPDLIGKMTNALRHRGPDDEGYVAADTQEQKIKVVALGGSDSTIKSEPRLDRFTQRATLYLGHRRLAILDLSAAGRQPMRYGSHLWIVFNGEIYNYLELRRELKAEGYEFHTGTDTEVILAAYARWGQDCVTRFNGDWAFCILDTERHCLFLSRDRYGVKPLYFFQSNESFAFASEIKALLTLPFVPRLLDRDQAFHYCALLCRDHTERTLFDGIHQLMPAHNMAIDLRTGATRQGQYYTIPFQPELGEYDYLRAKSHAADVRDLLTDAVRLRLRADVPVGTCLSGGLDSSSIVAITAKILGNGTAGMQNTFTASFPGHSFDESAYARLVIDATGARGHFVYPSKDEYWRAMPAILHHQDEPFGGPSIYSEWEVMREASMHVKVVLDGHAGDEVFAGYKEHRMSLLADLLTKGKVTAFLTEIWSRVKHVPETRKALMELKTLPFFLLSDAWKRKVYCLRYRKMISLAEKALNLDNRPGLEHIELKFKSNLNVLLFYFMRTYTLPHLLSGEDRSSMAHSIEARVPFTDYRLVDYMFSLPGVYKIHNGWSKWLLRLAVVDLLPPEIIWRRDKLGFATPRWASRQEEWTLWMRQNFPNFPMQKMPEA